MARPFLTAEWKNLVMANYAVDPSVLRPYLPCFTELDLFDGVHYVSLVGFLFTHTKIQGVSIPFHTSFEEVNLRFYVRYKDKEGWKRGVVFMKEIVPRRMISFVANTLYGENYATHPMHHVWALNDGALQVEYHWKVDGAANFVKATAAPEASPLEEGSEAEFITEHYWGYTHVGDNCTGVYEVQHPKWRVHRVSSYDICCSTEKLYGAAFSEALSQSPRSVFLAEGSPVQVFPGTKLYAR